MKKEFLVCAALAAVLNGCASGGASNGGSAGFGGNATTMFSDPKGFSEEEFKKDSKSYAKSWSSVGADIEFKKVTIPTCTVEFQRLVYDVNRSKLGALLKGDGTKSELTMGVELPVDRYDKMLREITTASCNRLKEKFKKIGAEVVEWSEVKGKYPEAVSFEKDRLSADAAVANEMQISYAGEGFNRLNRGMWAFGASSLSREAELSIVLPNFGVGFGYFGGEATPYSITEKHDFAELQFTPQVQIYAGSGFSYHSKWDGGAMVLKSTMVDSGPFVKKLEIVDDSRAAAKKSGEQARGILMGATGAEVHETQVSTRGRVNYDMVLDEAKFKNMVLKELDQAENIVVERYRNAM
ncbi:hypothetical protein AZI86_09505 [Bdellovibrio bacteriovorus]|uniref:Lipoprotein n=1 Tax=Bdellovibrio bacteriovorus TaxID=959 RepID=A0A150WRU4_BDEBC|nr:hypothetical protein [Bdellovibrio bacteriovorus]KYG67231.1 hypothetical protein AZI86_09505 [Bdellovibrio bacteriovorus]